MLIKFEVKNFRNFKDWFILNLDDTKNYEFGLDAIKNSTVNKGLIFGINGSGKSNVGYAIFDIISHLTDKEFSRTAYDNYTNSETDDDLVEFKYTLSLMNNIVEYSYAKTAIDELISETLVINDKTVLSLDRNSSNEYYLDLVGTETLNRNLGDSKISAVKYVHNNSALPENDENIAFRSFINFVENMLLFRSVEGNSYQGYSAGSDRLSEDIIKKGNLKDFERFLATMNINYKLEIMEVSGENRIGVVFGNKTMDIWKVSSTGTKSLMLFYFWLQRFKDVTFLFIDEFDAFYHYEISNAIVRQLLEYSHIQALLTTHNTSLLSNDLLRPDCNFILNDEVIKPIFKCTDKDLRFAHNIEKMFKAGSFNV